MAFDPRIQSFARNRKFQAKLAKRPDQRAPEPMPCQARATAARMFCHSRRSSLASAAASLRGMMDGTTGAGLDGRLEPHEFGPLPDDRRCFDRVADQRFEQWPPARRPQRQSASGFRYRERPISCVASVQALNYRCFQTDAEITVASPNNETAANTP